MRWVRGGAREDFDCTEVVRMKERAAAAVSGVLARAGLLEVRRTRRELLLTRAAGEVEHMAICPFRHVVADGVDVEDVTEAKIIIRGLI